MVTAAAAIMVCVFLSFMLGEDRVIKEFGLSLASAVFLDALVVRCLLLPATLICSASGPGGCPPGSTECCRSVNVEGTTLPADVQSGPPGRRGLTRRATRAAARRRGSSQGADG